MLSRVLEPEVMDTEEEARDYDSMDHSEVNQAFAADFLATGADLSGVLDLGTGTAQIPLELCRQSGEIHLTAVDLAGWMLKVAEQNVREAGLSQRIQLACADAKALPFEAGAFSATISNSIVHHVPEPMHVLKEAARVTAPGGVLFFRDLLRPADRDALAHLVETYAGEANEHQQEMFRDSLRAALNLDEVRELVGQLGFAPETVEQTTDRHWTWSARKSGG